MATDRSHWYLSLILAVIVFWSVHRLGTTAFGRCLRTVRDAEIAAGSLGISTTKYKLFAFALSAFIAALAGGLFGQLLTFATPDTFHTPLLIQFLVVVFVGGVNRLSGTVVGAVFVIVSRELFQDVGDWQRMVFGISLVLAVRFLPGGLTSLGAKVRGLRRTDIHAGPGRRRGRHRHDRGDRLMAPPVDGTVDRPVDAAVGAGADPASAPPLAVEGIDVRFGGNQVLSGVELEITHDFTGLIGPNGAGKTTLFNVISGYVPPAAGTVRIDGQDVTGASQTAVARLGVGRTFQTPKLIGDLSVLDNVLIGIDGRTSLLEQLREGLLYGSSVTAKRQWAHEVLDRFALGAVADAEAASLPLGSQKIVEVCRALVTRPRLLLLDEPAAGLGRDDVTNLVGPLRAWVAEHGTNVVIIEHDLELVTDLSDDVAVLHVGHIIARGTPEECLSNPLVIEAYLGAGVAEGE